MDRARRVGVLGAVLAVVATIVACQPYPSGGRETVTLAVSTLNNPYFRQLRTGARQAAQLAGVRLEVVGAGNSVERQARQLRAAAEDSEAVLVNPVDSLAADSAVRPVLRADIPVVAVDRAVPEADVTSTVVSDNVDGGMQAAEAVAAAVEGPGQVIHLQGVPDTSSSINRGRGFAQGIAFHEEIDVVARQPAYFDEGSAREVTRQLMRVYPEVDAIFAENDEMALGAIKALGARAGKDVMVVGFDGTPDGLKAIQDGTLVATIAQQPKLLGSKAVEQAVKAAKGEAVQQVVDVEVKVITKQNVAEFAK